MSTKETKTRHEKMERMVYAGSNEGNMHEIHIKKSYVPIYRLISKRPINSSSFHTRPHFTKYRRHTVLLCAQPTQGISAP